MERSFSLGEKRHSDFLGDTEPSRVLLPSLAITKKHCIAVTPQVSGRSAVLIPLVAGSSLIMTYAERRKIGGAKKIGASSFFALNR
jgi:hypothetical protein